MADFDNAELLTDIRARGSISSADIRFTDATLLAAATLELRDSIAPLLVESQSERGVVLEAVTVVAGTAEYRLPSRALAARFKSLAFQDSGGQEWRRLRHLSADAYYLQSDSAQGTPAGFFLRDNVVVLVPTPNAAGTLRLPYYLRPNKLVAEAECATVSVLGSMSLEVLGVPAAFASGLLYDVVRGSPGFETLAQGLAGTISGTTITFASELPTGVLAPSLNDYVCLSGQSPVAQCPVELRALLATRAARRVVKSVSDGTQASMLDADVAELTQTARDILAPRADAEPQEWGDMRRGVLYGLM